MKTYGKGLESCLAQNWGLINGSVILPRPGLLSASFPTFLIQQHWTTHLSVRGQTLNLWASLISNSLALSLISSMCPVQFILMALVLLCFPEVRPTLTNLLSSNCLCRPVPQFWAQARSLKQGVS